MLFEKKNNCFNWNSKMLTDISLNLKFNLSDNAKCWNYCDLWNLLLPLLPTSAGSASLISHWPRSACVSLFVKSRILWFPLIWMTQQVSPKQKQFTQKYANMQTSLDFDKYTIFIQGPHFSYALWVGRIVLAASVLIWPLLYLDFTFTSDLETGPDLDNSKLFCVTAIWHIPTQSDEQK